MKPYTYYLEWTDSGMKYYGARYGKNCDPTDLFNTYFTSSKYVKEHIEQFGNPDIIQIDKTFETPDEAQDYEHQILNELNVASRDDYLK